MRDRETFRGQHSEFFVSGPDIDFDVETWRCGCRHWPIVVATTTHSNKIDPETLDLPWPKREAWFVRNCRICGEMPRPIDDDRDVRFI